MDYAAYAAEHPGCEGSEVRGKGWGGGCDDGHGFIDAGGGVRHDADDLASVFHPALGRTRTIENLLELGDRHARENADEEFARQRFLDPGLRQDFLGHLRFAAQQHDVRLLHSFQILVLQDREVGR